MYRNRPAIAVAYDFIRIGAGWDVHCLRIGEDFPERDNAAVIIPALIFVYPYPVSEATLRLVRHSSLSCSRTLSSTLKAPGFAARVQNLITAPARSS